MKKNNRLIYLIIIILTIWNIILTVVLVNKKGTVNETKINEVVVSGFSTDLTKVVNETKSSVVLVETNSALSTGVIYKSSGDTIYLLTTFHGVNDAKYINVEFISGKTVEAKLIGKDIFSDVAILEAKVDFDVKPFKAGDVSLLNDGEYLIGIGTPKEKQYAFSSELALVSKKLRTINNSIEYNNNNYNYYLNVVQISSNMLEGYSGSPLINMAGEMIGMVTMKDDACVFALPINEIKLIADNIINQNEYSKAQFGFKGLFIKDLETYSISELNIPLNINSGIYVNGIMPFSFASKLGLKEGDIITNINDLKINTIDDLLNVEYSNKEAYSFSVVRNNETISLKGNIND